MNITERLLQFTSPCLTLQLRRGKYSPASLKDEGTFRQFSREAGLGGGLFVPESGYDALLAAASNHGYWLETLSNP